MMWLALPQQGGSVPRRSGWAGRAITDQLLERLPQTIAWHIPQPLLGLSDIVAPGLRFGRQAIAAHQGLIRGIIPFERGPRALGVPRGEIGRSILVGPIHDQGHWWYLRGRGQTIEAAHDGLRHIIDMDRPAPKPRQPRDKGGI